ncbi:MAG: hypothetical protein IPM32_15800 [Ignavibacteriae bacterium]|nr:hypothetical protein [Ignavibacteriota bacterium]
MLTILGYNNSEDVLLNKILLENDVEFKYSLSENLITSADKIILPNPQNFNSAYKRMQMMNLFSFLRLLKKPILGINDGFCLMCDEILDKYKCGLGFFQLDVNSNSENIIKQNFVTGKVFVNSDSKLLNENFNNSEIKFDKNFRMNECEFNSSKIIFGEKSYSLTCEHKNYFSVEMDFEQNPEIAANIILNFVKL